MSFQTCKTKFGKRKKEKKMGKKKVYTKISLLVGFRWVDVEKIYDVQQLVDTYEVESSVAIHAIKGWKPLPQGKKKGKKKATYTLTPLHFGKARKSLVLSFLDFSCLVRRI